MPDLVIGVSLFAVGFGAAWIWRIRWEAKSLLLREGESAKFQHVRIVCYRCGRKVRPHDMTNPCVECRVEIKAGGASRAERHSPQFKHMFRPLCSGCGFFLKVVEMSGKYCENCTKKEIERITLAKLLEKPDA